MSDIAGARDYIEEAMMHIHSRFALRYLDKALAKMHREVPKHRYESRFVRRITARKRQQIINLRLDGWSVPDISIKLGVNSRSVSHIINGKNPDGTPRKK